MSAPGVSPPEDRATAEREALHPWSLVMAVSSLVFIAACIVAPRALSPRGWSALHAAWTLCAFGYLFVRIRGYRRRADLVTAARVLLCPVLFAAHALDPHAAWWKVAIGISILLLDGVDGRVARRDGATGTGAVFDMESDAFYVVTMCAIAHVHLGVTPFVFIIGAMRPIYVCVWATIGLLFATVSPNRPGTLRGRLIHVGLVVALLVDLGPGIPLGVRNAVAVVAIGLILYSYAVDVIGTFRPDEAGGG